MLNSIELDSVADEALFGSGHPGTWNQSRLSGQFPRNCNHSNTNGLTTHSIPHLDENSLNDLYVFGDEKSPDTDMQNPQGHVFTDQASGNAHVNMPQPGTSQGTNSSGPKENEDPVVRKKIFKNKENRSKNLNQRNIPSHMQNGIHDAIPVENGPVLQNLETSWSPKLQFKNYDNDNNEAVRKRSRNGTKQKKQNMNKNSVLVQKTPDSQPCANDSPNENFNRSRPSQLIYPRINDDDMLRGRRDHVIQPQQTDVDLEQDVFFSVHGLKRPNNDTLPISGGNNNDDHDDGNRHSGQALINVGSNFTRLQNNLWDNRSSDKNRNLPRIPVEPFTGSLPQHNLEIDSELPDENTTVLKLPNTLANQGQRQVSNHDLRLSPSIVVPFEHNNPSDNAVQCLQISPNVLTQANSTSASISNIPTSVSSNPGSSDALITLESLPSNLSSSLFFGGGENDFLLAQQLERKQKDILQRDFYNPLDLQTNHSYDFETENYYTANEMASRSDGINDVYDPGQHVALEYQSRGGDGYRGNQETSVCRQPDVITVPHEIQNDEFYPDEHVNYFPDTADSGNNDHLVQVGFSQPETTHRDFSVQEQGSADEEHEFDDETYARMLQEQLYLDTEQQDEQFARLLQEREGNAMLFGDREPIHHTRLTRTESEDNENLPLHARYGETMNRDALTRDSSGHRPLRVGPPLNQSHALANNVFDGRIRGQSTWDRPLQRGNEFAFLETVRNLPPVREPASPGYDIPPDYYYRYEIDPDYGDDHLVSISRDPHMLASLLMERAPGMMIPNEVDLNDYEALWELAEGLGEVRRVGMEQEEISLLPVHMYQAPEVADEENSKSDCLVCLNEFESGEKLRTLPCCHIYHVECIDEWLKRNAVCPVCRQSASQQ